MPCGGGRARVSLIDTSSDISRYYRPVCGAAGPSGVACWRSAPCVAVAVPSPVTSPRRPEPVCTRTPIAATPGQARQLAQLVSFSLKKFNPQSQPMSRRSLQPRPSLRSARLLVHAAPRLDSVASAWRAAAGAAFLTSNLPHTRAATCSRWAVGRIAAFEARELRLRLAQHLTHGVV